MESRLLLIVHAMIAVDMTAVGGCGGSQTPLGLAAAIGSRAR
jgi:hypothetical protein